VPIAAITALGKTVLLVVAVTFILWALYTSMSIPKRRPGFPKRLDAYILVSAILFVAQIGAVVWVTGTQEVEQEAATEEPSTPTETEPAPVPGGDATAGKAVFTGATAGCGNCHTLADAGASGTVGPNLDDAKPSAELVVDRVTNGKGVMPSFKDKLSEEDIANVAAYVSSVAGAS
jgi:mono/diheme cytochrome c family protein